MAQLRNPENYKPEEALEEYDFGHGAQRAICHPTQRTRQSKGSIRLVSCKPTPPASGIIGLELEMKYVPRMCKTYSNHWICGTVLSTAGSLSKKLPYHIQTVCHPERDMIAARLSPGQPAGIKFHFPYPTGGHCDDAFNWEANDKHSTTLVSEDAQSAVLKEHSTQPPIM